MKKKIVRQAALIGCVMMFLQGCANGGVFFTQEETQEYMPERRTEYVPDVPEAREASQEEGTETGETEEIEVPEIYYAYHALDKERQKIYLEMLDALENMRQDARLSTLDKSVIDPVFACVMNDHPELFYVEGYQYTEYTFGDAITGITFSGTYSMTEQEAEQTKLLIEQVFNECYEQAPADGDEYNTARFLYEWLIAHTDYDKTAENNQNISSVFLQGKSVCQGYAKAMQYMLQKANMQCLLVTGFTNSERHAWDLVKVNNAYYYLDPTWGDASYACSSSEGGGNGYGFPSINYDYFLVTTDEITRTHSFEKVVPLPECAAISDNYFVREGLYFEEYDETHLAGIFASDAAKAADYVTVKCSDASVFERMTQELISDQKVFDFIDRQGTSIAYASNEEQRTVSFWNIY